MAWNIQSGKDPSNKANNYNGLERDLSVVSFTFSPTGNDYTSKYFTSLASSNSAIYAITSDTRVYAMDLSGNQLWEYGYSQSPLSRKLTYANNYLYFLSGGVGRLDRVVKINATDPYSEAIKYYEGSPYITYYDYIQANSIDSDYCYITREGTSGFWGAIWRELVFLDSSGGSTGSSNVCYNAGRSLPTLINTHSIKTLSGSEDILYDISHTEWFTFPTGTYNIGVNKWKASTTEFINLIAVRYVVALPDPVWFAPIKGIVKTSNCLHAIIGSTCNTINLDTLNINNSSALIIYPESGPALSLDESTLYYMGNLSGNGKLVAYNATQAGISLKWIKTLDDVVFEWGDQIYKVSQKILPVINNDTIIIQTISGIYLYRDMGISAEEVANFLYPTDWTITDAGNTYMSTPLFAGDGLTVFSCNSSVYGLGFPTLYINQNITWTTSWATPLSANICFTDITTTSNTASLITGTIWDFGDGTQSTLITATTTCHIYSPLSTYNISVSAFAAPTIYSYTSVIVTTPSGGLPQATFNYNIQFPGVIF